MIQEDSNILPQIIQDDSNILPRGSEGSFILASDEMMIHLSNQNIGIH